MYVKLASRLSLVQGEVERLSRTHSDATSHDTERLHRLKAEFTHLLRELRKRKSITVSAVCFCCHNRVDTCQTLDLFDYFTRWICITVLECILNISYSTAQALSKIRNPGTADTTFALLVGQYSNHLNHFHLLQCYLHHNLHCCTISSSPNFRYCLQSALSFIIFNIMWLTVLALMTKCH